MQRKEKKNTINKCVSIVDAWFSASNFLEGFFAIYSRIRARTSKLFICRWKSKGTDKCEGIPEEITRNGEILLKTSITHFSDKTWERQTLILMWILIKVWYARVNFENVTFYLIDFNFGEERMVTVKKKFKYLFPYIVDPLSVLINTNTIMGSGLLHAAELTNIGKCGMNRLIPTMSDCILCVYSGKCSFH